MRLRTLSYWIHTTCLLALLAAVTSCANMGSPQGGLYDEEPPRIVYASPAEKAINVNTNKISIFFNEYVKIENATEKGVHIFLEEEYGEDIMILYREILNWQRNGILLKIKCLQTK